MKPKTTLSISIAVLVALLVLVALFTFAAKPAAAPIEEQAPETMTLPSSPATTVVITYTDSGFMPKTATIKNGTTVRFVNQSTHSLWVGSDAHPTHTNYDGTTLREHCASGGAFDQCHAASAGESWEYTFLKTGSFGYHNHTSASHSGTISVE